MSLDFLPMRSFVFFICGMLAGILASSLLVGKQERSSAAVGRGNAFTVQLTAEHMAKNEKEVPVGSRIYIVKLGKSLHLRDACKVHRRPAKLLAQTEQMLKVGVHTDDLLFFKSLLSELGGRSLHQSRWCLMSEKEASEIRSCIRYQQVSYAM